MLGLLRRPKVFSTVVVALLLVVIGIFGGALGNALVKSGGFLGSPIAHIQLPAEAITSGPILLGFTVTNTMIATWSAVVVLVVISLLGTRRLNEVPGRLQGFLEVVLTFFIDLAVNVAGPSNGRRFFPLVMTIFLFVVVANWMGVLPGFGTIGRFETAEEIIHHVHEQEECEFSGDHTDGGHKECNYDLSKVNMQVFNGLEGPAFVGFGSIDDVITAEQYENGVKDLENKGKRVGRLVPFFRSANTDLNTTLAIAIVAMITVHWWGLRILGVFGHVGKYLNFRQGPIGLFVGVLEAISEVARVISFTFRLFGNIFAGEVLLIAMAFLVPLVGLVPFLGLELFVGLIQAFIFSMLTLVFASMATVGHDEEDH